MNEDDFNKRFNGMVINTSWTQPYLPTSYNPFYERSVPRSELTVQEELERLQEIDDQVALMDTYPQAENIIRKIMKQND